MKLEKILDKKSLYNTLHYGVVIDGHLIVTNRFIVIVTPLKALIKEEDVNKLEGYIFDYEGVKLLSSKDSKKLEIEDGILRLGNIEHKAVDKYGENGEAIKLNYNSKYSMKQIAFVEKGEPVVIKAISGSQLGLFETVVEKKNSFTCINAVKGKEKTPMYYLTMQGDESGTYGVLMGISNPYI